MGVAEVDPQAGQGAHRARGEAVPAHLVAPVGRPIEDHRAGAVAGGSYGGGGACRPGADDY